MNELGKYKEVTDILKLLTQFEKKTYGPYISIFKLKLFCILTEYIESLVRGFCLSSNW